MIFNIVISIIIALLVYSHVALIGSTQRRLTYLEDVNRLNRMKNL